MNKFQLVKLVVIGLVGLMNAPLFAADAEVETKVIEASGEPVCRSNWAIEYFESCDDKSQPVMGVVEVECPGDKRCVAETYKSCAAEGNAIDTQSKKRVSTTTIRTRYQESGTDQNAACQKTAARKTAELQETHANQVIVSLGLSLIHISEPTRPY